MSARRWTIQTRERKDEEWVDRETSEDGVYIVRKLKALRMDGAHARLVDADPDAEADRARERRMGR